MCLPLTCEPPPEMDSPVLSLWRVRCWFSSVLSLPQECLPVLGYFYDSFKNRLLFLESETWFQQVYQVF